jgi:hypothetical protein
MHTWPVEELPKRQVLNQQLFGQGNHESGINVHKEQQQEVGVAQFRRELPHVKANYYDPA